MQSCFCCRRRGTSDQITVGLPIALYYVGPIEVTDKQTGKVSDVEPRLIPRSLQSFSPALLQA